MSLEGRDFFLEVLKPVCSHEGQKYTFLWNALYAVLVGELWE
jgi:hypothetical protein